MRQKIKIEMFYTLTCFNCKIMKHLLDEVIKNYPDKFELKQTNASLPLGIVKTMKLGIHTVPTLLINSEIAFKCVPTKQELIDKLNKYINN